MYLLILMIINLNNFFISTKHGFQNNYYDRSGYKASPLKSFNIEDLHQINRKEHIMMNFNLTIPNLIYIFILSH